MKFFFRIVTVACLMLFTVQCEVIDSGLLEDPNAVSPENVNPDFLLNNIQFNTQQVYEAAAELGAEMSRMRYMFGSTYGNAYTASDFNAVYFNAYADLFIDVKNLLPIVEDEERALYFHAGMAKTLQAYTMILMVDVFGDVPFAEALDPGNFNPALDDGEAIYNRAIELLDEAIADFQNGDRRAMPANDFFYGGLSTSNKVDRWVRAANTIKLKAFLNTGNTSGINALIADGADSDLILEPSHDFRYSFSTNDVNPDSRHPLYANNYDNLANDYMTVNYLNMLGNDKPEMDPRMRYYFYRQTTQNTTDTNENRCITEFPPSHFQAGDPYCYPEGNLADGGWWGRDHLIDEGIPPDNGLRTTFGVYPAGGKFDANQGESVEKGDGLAGAGFEPILMSSFTYFMVAEAAQVHGTNSIGTSAKEDLKTAIELSMETVADFGEDLAEGTGFEIVLPDDAENYWAVVDPRFDPDPLRTIAKEYYFALWPNGYEAYNLMRRTQFPDRDDNLQPALNPAPGDWYRAFLYPANMVERNANVSQRTDLLQGVFWDPFPGSTKFNF